jgi:hypothetical protein
VGPRAGLDDVEKRKFFTLPELELRPLGRRARKPVGIPHCAIPAQYPLPHDEKCTGYSSYGSVFHAGYYILYERFSLLQKN